MNPRTIYSTLRTGILLTLVTLTIQGLAVMPTQDKALFERIRQEAEGAVVNVLAQRVTFNWREPYKTSDFHEVRATGFFINPEGDILTNYHVIEQATQIWIQLLPLGQEKISATIKGVCPERDLALLQLCDAGRTRIHKKLGHISYLPLGDSDSVKRADEVMGLGYPLAWPITSEGRHGRY